MLRYLDMPPSGFSQRADILALLFDTNSLYCVQSLISGHVRSGQQAESRAVASKEVYLCAIVAALSRSLHKLMISPSPTMWLHAHHFIPWTVGPHTSCIQGRRHGFLSGGGGGTNRRQCGQPTPKYPNNRERHRIWVASFSNLEGRPLLTFHCEGRVPPAPDVHGCTIVCTVHLRSLVHRQQ